jgi:hypothetical protein
LTSLADLARHRCQVGLQVLHTVLKLRARGRSSAPNERAAAAPNSHALVVDRRRSARSGPRD